MDYMNYIKIFTSPIYIFAIVFFISAFIVVYFWSNILGFGGVFWVG